MLLFGAVNVSLPGPLTFPANVVDPVGVAFTPVPPVAWTWISVSDWSTTALLILTTSPVSFRIAPGNTANGPDVAPVPFRFSGPDPNVYVPPAIRSSCAPALIVKLAVAVGA